MREGRNEKIKEITNIIERLELLEEKFGITISGLYADSKPVRVNGVEGYIYIRINFDLTSLAGDKLERDFSVVASVYNSAGQLLDTKSTLIYADKFNGFSSVSMSLYDLDQTPAKIRLFPKVGF
jgi:hypothetical protein